MHGAGASGLTISDKLDAILTHKVWGWVAFLGAMALMFVAIFAVAQIPMGWIEQGTDWMATWITNHMPEGDFRSLLTNGVIAGVGGVVIFLPQILILYFFLGLLEDSGYMARAAFIMDRLMSRVGLHGKSFIPLLSSFACAIPGIMATRTVENRKDRLVTIMVAPLMSCSARLPVYAIMIAVLMPVATAWQKAGIMLCMYMVGIVAAFGMAWLFKRTLSKGETPMLLLEMPPYRTPSLQDDRHSDDRARGNLFASCGYDHPGAHDSALGVVATIRSHLPRRRRLPKQSRIVSPADLDTRWSQSSSRWVTTGRSASV